MKKFAYWYVTGYTSLLVIAHLLGASGIKVIEYSRNVHLALLMVSFLLLIGLFYRDRWAYRLGVLLYGFHALQFPFGIYHIYAHEGIADFFGFFDWCALLGAFVSIIFLAIDKARKKNQENSNYSQ